jgi:hypothetical protein
MRPSSAEALLEKKIKKRDKTANIKYLFVTELSLLLSSMEVLFKNLELVSHS